MFRYSSFNKEESGNAIVLKILHLLQVLLTLYSMWYEESHTRYPPSKYFK